MHLDVKYLSEGEDSPLNVRVRVLLTLHTAIPVLDLRQSGRTDPS